MYRFLMRTLGPPLLNTALARILSALTFTVRDSHGEVQVFSDSPWHSPGLLRQRLQGPTGNTYTKFVVEIFHDNVTTLVRSGYGELTVLDPHQQSRPHSSPANTEHFF